MRVWRTIESTVKQLEGQRRALAEHLEKIANELQKPVEEQDQGLIAYWEKLLPIAVSRFSSCKGDSRNNRESR